MAKTAEIPNACHLCGEKFIFRRKVPFGTKFICVLCQRVILKYFREARKEKGKGLTPHP